LISFPWFFPGFCFLCRICGAPLQMVGPEQLSFFLYLSTLLLSLREHFPFPLFLGERGTGGSDNSPLGSRLFPFFSDLPCFMYAPPREPRFFSRSCTCFFKKFHLSSNFISPPSYPASTFPPSTFSMVWNVPFFFSHRWLRISIYFFSLTVFVFLFLSRCFILPFSVWLIFTLLAVSCLGLVGDGFLPLVFSDCGCGTGRPVPFPALPLFLSLCPFFLLWWLCSCFYFFFRWIGKPPPFCWLSFRKSRLIFFFFQSVLSELLEPFFCF